MIVVYCSRMCKQLLFLFKFWPAKNALTEKHCFYPHAHIILNGISVPGSFCSNKVTFFYKTHSPQRGYIRTNIYIIHAYIHILKKFSLWCLLYRAPCIETVFMGLHICLSSFINYNGKYSFFSLSSYCTTSNDISVESYASRLPE